MYKISVIMPVYNTKEEYLREAIESILNQTYSDFEFIIVDDGSTETYVKDVILSYNDNRIKYFYKENGGITSALNYGLDKASGEFIARMDSDDVSLAERFEKQISFFESNPDVSLCGTWFKMFPENKIIKLPQKVTFLRLLEGNSLGHPTVMWRKADFEKYGFRYCDKYIHAEDYELWSRVIKCLKIGNVQEVLLKYRWDGQNISVKKANIQSEGANKVQKDMLNFLTNDIKMQKDILSLLYPQQNKPKIKPLEYIFSIRNLPDKKHKRLILFGIKIKFKKKRYNKLLNLHIDDSQLLEELQSLGEFSYAPNSGNMGDMLIAEATMQWFDENLLTWKRLEENEIPDNFVYGGGGAWIKTWIKDLQPLMDKMKKCKKIVILPSSFNDVQEFVDILDEKFVVFCREKKSYDYLVSRNTKAKILLDHDMALRLKYSIKAKNAPNEKLKKLSRQLNEKVSTLNKDVSLFRIDTESKYQYKTDLDISDCLGWFNIYEPRENIQFAVSEMFRIISKFKTIKTDRLHVGIVGTLLSKNVLLYDNSYGKISGVYEQSLKKLSNVKYMEKGKI